MLEVLCKFIEEAEDTSSTEELFRYFDKFVRNYGVDVSSYILTAKELQSVPIEAGLIHDTLPPDWVQRYIKRKYSDIDPVNHEARHVIEPFHWFDIEKKVTLRPEQVTFLHELKAAGLVDGIAIPIFGPMGTVACFGLGSMTKTLPLTHQELVQLQLAAQYTHNRYIELTSHHLNEPPSQPLSPRETEVLSLVATGLQNAQVANRLHIATTTVDTILQRAYRKLDVTNRMSAVLKGIGAGLILP